MNFAEKLGFGPKRESRQLIDGNFVVRVTPPAITGFSSSEIKLTADQFRRFNLWLGGGLLIQDVFPDLAAWQREILQTGIGPGDWDAAFK